MSQAVLLDCAHNLSADWLLSFTSSSLRQAAVQCMCCGDELFWRLRSLVWSPCLWFTANTHLKFTQCENLWERFDKKMLCHGEVINFDVTVTIYIRISLPIIFIHLYTYWQCLSMHRAISWHVVAACAALLFVSQLFAVCFLWKRFTWGLDWWVKNLSKIIT